MKIYILRHAERENDPAFFTPLTNQGKKNAETEILDKLERENIDKIFCSPFIRTMQTIYPYSKKYFMQLNLDYALIDNKNKLVNTDVSQFVALPLELAKQYNYNPDYFSSITTVDIVYPENIEQLKQRILKFTNSIIKKYKNSNKNIIFVTHQYPCMVLANLAREYGNGKVIPDNNSLTNYKMGQLSLIYDETNTNENKSAWTFKVIK